MADVPHAVRRRHARHGALPLPPGSLSRERKPSFTREREGADAIFDPAPPPCAPPRVRTPLTRVRHPATPAPQIEFAGLLALSLGSYLDFWIIFCLLMTNATLGFVEEMNAQASISALKDGMIRKLPVKRDGNFTPLNVAEIVPGDVVFLRGGNVVPADAKWVEGDELEVDQAALTGESMPVQVPREDSDGEPGSGKKLWGGSILKTGECEAFVTETGLNTMIGEAAKAIQESGGKHVGVFEAKIIMAGRVLIVLTLIAVGSLLIYQVRARLAWDTALARRGRGIGPLLHQSLSPLPAPGTPSLPG